MKQRPSTGFTLVELLIVIVVIAILAAITLVTYRGIQQKANNTSTINTAAAMIKLITVSHQLNGTVHITDLPSGAIGLCVGNPNDYAKPIGNLASKECYDGVFGSEQLYAALSEAGTASMQPYAFDQGNGQWTRGIQMTLRHVPDADDEHVLLWYDLIGVHDEAACTLPDAVSPETAPNETDCYVDMTKLLGEHPFTW